VLVVDDSEIFQRVGASLVSDAQGLHLVGVAASGEEAIRLLPELKPDLVLLDIHMPGIGGLEAARVIRRESPRPSSSSSPPTREASRSTLGRSAQPTFCPRSS
jgi:two-component system invasion response regulator UvrY